MDSVPGLTFQQVMAVVAFIHFLMKWLKRQEWYRQFVKSFPAADVWVYRGVAGILSLITAVGIHWVVTPDAATGGWNLRIAVPGLETMWNSVSSFDVASIFGGQQLAYEMTRRPQEMPHDFKASKKVPHD